MARNLRPQISGGIYHVISKGNRAESIFVDSESRRYHMSLCTLTRDRYGWSCAAFCQMGTHYHLLLRTPKPNVSAAMQYLNARYAEWFNWRHGYRGHLFQGRFWSELVDTERYLAEVARYIALNPLRAGLCRDPLDWPWSSYAATIGLGPAPDFLTCEWLLELFGSSLNNARAAYRSFVSQAAPVIHRDVSGV